MKYNSDSATVKIFEQQQFQSMPLRRSIQISCSKDVHDAIIWRIDAPAPGGRQLAAYQRMGLLSRDLASNEYTPKDFSDERKLSLLQGYSLNAEIVINGLGDQQPPGYRASDM